MYVSQLRIDRFGVCSELSIDSLGPGLNVVHGPRSSGKTTVVDFLRAVLHGFDPQLRQRYRPVESSRFGGVVTLQGSSGWRAIRRYDDGGAGRLRIENERGLHDEPGDLHELYGAISPALLEQAFAIDFERDASIDSLLDEASRQGFELRDRGADPARLAALDRDLADARHRLASLGEPLESRELLDDRRRRIVEEIHSLEARQRRSADEQDRQRARRASLVFELQRQLDDARREATALDHALARLLERRRLLEVDLAALRQEGQTAPWQEELRSIDVQLERWRRTLRDLAVAKNDADSPPCDLPVVQIAGSREQAEPRRHLKSLEASTVQLQQLLAKLSGVGSIACSCRDVRIALDESLRQLREEIYQACNAFNVWQTYFQERLAASETRQFSRCETEMHAAIATLVERRQRLLSRVDRPAAVLRPDHGELCECTEHPRLVDATVGRQPRIESLETALREIDAELRQNEELRARAERATAELALRLEQARLEAEGLESRSSLGIDELRDKRETLAAIDRALNQWERRREISAHIACLDDERRALESQCVRSPILTDAGEFARRLSAGEIQRLGRDAEGQLWAQTSRGVSAPCVELDDGLRDQVRLAVCLALAAACERRGARLPIVVNAPFSRYSDQQVSEAIRFLQEFGVGRQILCFTRDEHAVRAARASNVPVGVLTIGVAAPYGDAKLGEAKFADSKRADAKFGDSKFVDATSVPRRTSSASTAQVVARARSPWDAEEFPGELEDRVRLSVAGRSRISADLDPGYRRSDDQELADDRRSGMDWTDTDPIQNVTFLSDEDLLELREAGVATLADLLDTSVDVLSARLRGTHVTRDMLAGWQTRVNRRTRRTGGKREAAAGASSRRESSTARVVQATSGGEKTDAGSQTAAAKGELRFFLHRGEPVDAAPSIGPSMAKKLEEIGIATIADLLGADAEAVVEKLGSSRVKGDTIRQWQQQTELCCRIPQLRGHDAQVLVAIGMTRAEDLAAISPAELWGRVEPFLSSSDAKRLLRGSSPPDLAEVTEWIEWARHARTLTAA